VIVDTNSYFGNFERELAAYTFGCLDINNTGGEYVTQGKLPLPWACNDQQGFGGPLQAHESRG
jgi:hypothetical protein